MYVLYMYVSCQTGIIIRMYDIFSMLEALF